MYCVNCGPMLLIVICHIMYQVYVTEVISTCMLYELYLVFLYVSQDWAHRQVCGRSSRRTGTCRASSAVYQLFTRVRICVCCNDVVGCGCVMVICTSYILHVLIYYCNQGARSEDGSQALHDRMVSSVQHSTHSLPALVCFVSDDGGKFMTRVCKVKSTGKRGLCTAARFC